MNNRKSFKISLNGFFTNLLIIILRFTFPSFYKTRVYNFIIAELNRKVKKLLPISNLPNYGNIEKGQLVLHGEVFTKDNFIRFKSFAGADINSKHQKDIHDFRWLSDLRAVNTIPAQERAIFLIESWIAKHGNKIDNIAWDPYVSSKRLFNIAYNYDFIANLDSISFHKALFNSIAKQVNHLYACSYKVKNHRKFIFLVNLAIINRFTENKPLFDKTIELIKKYIDQDLLPDGFFPNRNIVRSLDALYSLIMLEEVYTVSSLQFPKELRSAIDKIALTIKSVRHPDGNLPLFNGSYEVDKRKIDISLLKSATSGLHEVSNIRYGGYATILTDSVFIITDTGSQSKIQKNKFNSLLSSEISVNKYRLIVNRGYLVDKKRQQFDQSAYLRDIHSGVYFYDKKGKEIHLSLANPHEIKTKVYNNNNKPSINCNYTGLCKKHGITYNREITTETSESILFEELISTKDAKKISAFGIKINLHPSVNILDHKNNEVLLQTPDESTLVLKSSSKFEIGTTEFYGDYNRVLKTNFINIPLEFKNNTATLLWGIKFVKQDSLIK